MFSWLKWLLMQVKAWFQVVKGVSDHESFQAPMEDPPVTALLGPIDRLIHRLQSLEGSKHTLPKALSLSDIVVLGKHLKKFRNPLQNLSEMEDLSFMAKWWMKEVRELCFDTEDYLVEVTMQFGAGAYWSLWNLGRTVTTFVNWKLKFRRPKLSQFIDRAIGMEEVFPKYAHEEREAAISHMKVEESDAYLHKENKAAISQRKAEKSYAYLDKENKATIETLPSELINQLTFDDDKQTQLKVVAISGSAGAGKTALASTVYVKYKRKFQCRAFVRVSRNPDFRSILTSILSQIKAAPSHDFSDVQGLIVSINKHLQRKRYFVVIDDVRSPSVWDIISGAFPGGDFHSRIIVTTQSEQVEAAYSGYELDYAIFKIGTHNDGYKDTFRYNNLPHHLKTCLLYFSMYTEGCTVTKDDLVKQWVAEGFIAAIKRHHREERSQIPQNKIMEISEAPQDQAEEIEVVPQDENGEITKVPPKEMEKIAEGYFDELVTTGMIQPVDRNHEGEVLSCTVHHMVLDLIRCKSKEDNFIVVVDNLESTVGHPDIIRRLSIQFGSAKGASMPESIILSQVRSLAFYGFLGCVPSIAEYGLLRVLILNIWVDEDSIFDLSTIGELYHLRYLKTECNVTVRLPSKMQRLQHLGTLQVDARLCDVPSDIVHLEKLLHLHLPSDCILPHGIGRMTSLHSLGYFDLRSNSEDNVRGLNELENLQALQLTCSTGEPAESLERNMQLLMGSVLQKLSMLRSVTLAPGSGSCNGNTRPDYCAVSSMSISCEDFGSLSRSPAHHLQRLELSRHCCIFSRLPKWLGELTQLCILKIAVRELSKEGIDILKGLPALAALSLHVASAAAEMIVFGKGGFSVLTYLKFTCTVPWLKFEADAMPSLQKLRLGFNAPFAIVDEQGIIIEHLPGIKEISALISCAGNIGSDLLKAIRNDPRNPEVQLTGSVYYGDKGIGMMTREESGEDKNNKAHSRIQTPPQSSRLSVPARSRKEKSKHGHSLSEIISFPFESKKTVKHTRQAEEGATEMKKLCNTTKATGNLEFGASIAGFGVIMIVARYFLSPQDRGVDNQRYIIPLLLGFTCFISGFCLMLLSMNLLELPDHLVSERQRMISRYLSSLCSTLPVATLVSPLLLSGYKLYRYIGLALLVVAAATLAVVRRYVGLKAEGGDKEAAFKGHKEQLEVAIKLISNSAIGGVLVLVVNYNVTGGSGKTKSAVVVAIYFVFTILIWGLISMEVVSMVLEIDSKRLGRRMWKCVFLASAVIFMNLLLACAVLSESFAIVRFSIFAAFAPWVFAAAVHIFMVHRVGRAAAHYNNASEYQKAHLKRKAERGVKITVWSFTAIITIFGGFLHGEIESLKACIILLTSAFMSALLSWWLP